MELRNSLALYICAAVALAFIIVSFVNFRKKRKYKGGTKAVEASYLKEIPYYKFRLRLFKFLKVLLTLMIIVSLLLAGFLMARPYKTQVTEIQDTNRDIILCMDISTTVDELNCELTEKLQEIVSELQGERFGIVIFNTNPIVLCPPTTDYEYILNVLETVHEALELRVAVYNGTGMITNRYNELDEYISNGTLVNNEYRGSSVIGDGFAGGALAFNDWEVNPDRTRIMIFTTDNESNSRGHDYFTMQEASQLCQDRGILVYGIGTESMTTADEEEMREAVLATGGAFYTGEDRRTVNRIVNNINETVATLDEVHYEITEIDQPEIPFYLLLASVSMMMILAWISKV